MSNGDSSPLPDKVVVQIERSKHYRVIHVDGCFGGASHTGNLVICPYSERTAYPTEIVHKALESPDKDGFRVGEEIERKMHGQIHREFEVELVLSPSSAKSLHKWLGEKIGQLEGGTENDK